MKFKIDFLRPGQAFPKDNVLYRLKKNVTRFHRKATDSLIMGVGTSTTTLVISFSVLVFAFIFFYMAVYLPGEKSLQNQTEEIQQLEILVKSLQKKRAQEQAKRNKIKKRIKQLMDLKNETVSWIDKLKAINRNLVEGIWLTSLEVKRKALKSKPKPEEKKRRKRNKKKEPPKAAERVPTQTMVSISGSTYAYPENKPLKLIADFMNNLMNDPVWEKQFDLTDWVINTSEIKRTSDEDSEDIEDDLKRVSFTLELERKK
jgi:hypothetical protein